VADRTQNQIMLAGELYDPYDPELREKRRSARRLVHAYNATSPDDDRPAILRELLGGMGAGVTIHPPFHCDYGENIFVGSNVYTNVGCVILDCNNVEIEDNVMFGPHVQLYAAYHPVEASERIKKLELSSPIRVKENVWVGGGAIILPGVTIGENSTIGAGAVVTRDVPSGVVAAGNPARIIRRIEQ